MQPEVIVFDVGGQIFRTRRATVASSRVLSAAAASSTSVFLDRSPALFALVLDFLRTGQVVVDGPAEVAFLCECKHYELATMPVTNMSLRLSRWATSSVDAIRAHIAAALQLNALLLSGAPVCFMASPHVLALDLEDDAPGILKALAGQQQLLWVESAADHAILQACVQDVVDAFFHRHLLTLSVRQVKHLFDVRAPKKLAMSVQLRCVCVSRAMPGTASDE